ncbi:pentapeptide repeat-containing protein [Streptomyces olivochromogenes]|uniref:pentapeptide repeat-containing protein n=1 Tax=Streptomyces olivochromogenes TaxID=1963 RepID=UPI001F3A9D6D|nr:pentapeptide repeat-containing protein [Streptomyces olivochromogenes]MCF3136825.1 pentapeptide repeat-containing protein [Streptomyces olivochromogenes]
MTAHLPQRRTERRGLRLWPVGTVLALTFTAAILVAAAVFYTGWDLLSARGLKPEHRIDSKTLFDLVKLSFGVVAGAGALVALVVAYRRQRVDEDGALREATRLHTERFTTAVTQLGDESAAVRPGGVHALAGLADDAPTRALRQTCIDVLCAYLRLPYTAETDLPAGDTEARHTYLALREVRHTVIRLIRDHLRLRPEHPHSWQGHNFDLTEVTFDGGDFGGAQFSGGTVDFSGARFSGGTVNFRAAEFSGGTVNFTGAQFSGGTVNFRMARFSGGTVHFSAAEFSDGTVNLTGAQFSDGTVHFRVAQFSGGTVHFRAAEFSDGTVDFSRAQFSGGTVDFRAAEFSDGTVDFSGAEFCGGTVDFSTAAGGMAPAGLVPPSGSPLASGLSLPPAWYTAPA